MVLKLDRVWGHEITTPPAIIDMKARGVDVVFDPNRIKMMIDHVNPAKDTASAIQGKILRDWCRQHNIEFLDVGRNGVCHAVIPEKGWVLPGQIGIMGDSHTCTHGALCAFAAGVGTTDLENGIVTGLWVCPPQKVIRVNFVGTLPANVFAKDLILALIAKIGVKGATNAVLEFGGNVIDEMSMEGRMTITNMVVEAGATSGMMMVDETTINYLKPILIEVLGEHSEDISFASLRQLNSDPDAVYDQTIEIDVSTMTPLITQNYSPADVVPTSALAGKKVDQGYIGSCTNGRLEDLRIAAGIFLREPFAKVAEGVRCIVVPATQHIYEQAINEGLIEIFTKAGCYVSGPTCGACLGMSCGVLAPGEVCVSTTNRNFPGRMGKDGMVHLASPAVAALAALRGVITEPSANECVQAKFLASPHPFSLACHKTPHAVVPTGWADKDFVKQDYTALLAKVDRGASKDFSGKVFYLPADNVDTDQIIPAKYLTETEKSVFGKHCLEDAPIPSKDRSELSRSQILVAGENFGCGSSREHAPWALEAAGIRCVIAPSFARIFEGNMFANGLLCITLPKERFYMLVQRAPISISVDVDGGIIHWKEQSGPATGEDMGVSMTFSLSDYQKDLIRNGGSTGVMLKLAARLQKEGKI